MFLPGSSVYCADESAENRSTKTWSFEGSSAYRPYDVREYALGVTRFDNLSAARGASSLALGRLWTNRAYYGNRNNWKLDGHSLAVSYRKFFGNSFFGEAGLLAETFRAWAPSSLRYDEIFEDEDFGRAERLAMVLQLGNQWQWEHLNVGWSWFGAVVPLAHRQSKSIDDASFRSYLRSPTNLGIRLFLGWAI
jgi:hypothetical protein